MGYKTAGAALIGTASAALMACLGVAGARAQTPALPRIAKMPPSVAYRWKNVVIRGGGFVSGIEFSPAQAGLVYARTGVGGAYRSDDGGEHWVPLTDRFDQKDAGYLGIESIAVDPEDANKVYLAEGMYSASWGGPSAIFRSSDKGSTFERSPMPFKMGGNDDGRGVGERLAVDPNLGSVLYFGSRLAGLWRSTDSGRSWSRVGSFPVTQAVTGPGAKTGITFVAFDRSTGAVGRATGTIYVGVAQPGAGLYRSLDAGASWEVVAGAPTDLFPSHAAVDAGNHVYLSYIDDPGPNGLRRGAIWSYSPKDGRWKDISPVHPGSGGTRPFGFGGIAMDAEHPETLMVTTLDEWYPQDQIFRTTNAGRSWKEIGPNAEYAAPTVPWVYWHRGKAAGTGWMNDIEIDPFHAEKVMYTTGEGLFGSADITEADAGRPTHWGFPNEGLEELVALRLVSPPTGAPLLSVVGDLGGYRHESLDRSPSGGFFTHPQVTSGSGLDFAAGDPAIVVRVGYGDGKMTRGGYSTDDGVSWSPFATEPPSSREGGGRIAISPDGKTVVWTPGKGVPFVTNDWGRTWSACGGLRSAEFVVADRVNPLKFYSFRAETGQLLESVDGGHAFAGRSGPVGAKNGAKGGPIVLAPTPGREGDLWISAGEKVYHSSDEGVSFAELGGLTGVNNIGFGKPALGSSTPAIYLNGRVGDTEGILRSDDAGMSWVRVDDPKHQFGWKNDVIGDPRMYGRVYLATGGRGIVYGEPADGVVGAAAEELKQARGASGR